MSLYACLSGKHDSEWTMTKFNDDMEYQTAYTVSHDSCTCPAYRRDSCRHRDMLERFLDENHIGDGFILDYDNDQWIEPREDVNA